MKKRTLGTYLGKASRAGARDALLFSFALFLSLGFFLQALENKAEAQNSVTDVFYKLPDSEVSGIGSEERRNLVERSGKAVGYSAPSKAGFWVETSLPNVLTLYGIHHSPVVYKLFEGKEGHPDLLVICRSRQTSGPTRSDERIPDPPPMDISLYSYLANSDVIKVDRSDFIPPIGVLDFVTYDVIEDARARYDLGVINEDFLRCLTCHASPQDKLALDIVTVTSINAHSCAGFLPQFKLIPLSWNGEHFEKPYDRAASPDEPWIRRGPRPRGLYYDPPGN